MWVARDKYGHLILFIKNCPFRDEIDGMWVSNERPIYLDITLFSNLKWEDEPVKVVLINKNDLCKEYMYSMLISNEDKNATNKI